LPQPGRGDDIRDVHRDGLQAGLALRHVDGESAALDADDVGSVDHAGGVPAVLVERLYRPDYVAHPKAQPDSRRRQTLAEPDHCAGVAADLGEVVQCGHVEAERTEQSRRRDRVVGDVDGEAGEASSGRGADSARRVRVSDSLTSSQVSVDTPPRDGVGGRGKQFRWYRPWKLSLGPAGCVR
jgi:hypothetical protein